MFLVVLTHPGFCALKQAFENWYNNQLHHSVHTPPVERIYRLLVRAALACYRTVKEIVEGTSRHFAFHN